MGHLNAYLQDITPQTIILLLHTVLVNHTKFQPQANQFHLQNAECLCDPLDGEKTR